ncbi:MAG: nucleotidyl transferase AbiEii/AbiGii toxin family protein [Cyclobacteriaceae bacterium]|nr:nucleotidyl transferase AbiEii/AbiGii toxin family protein [Cyclobacteriaceae bacterium]
MAKINFYTIDNAEKAAIFTEIATQKGIKPFAVEKDWWVSRTIEIIFKMPIAEHLVFKGGTSLSKAWKLINRFSEDIDLAIDKKYFGFSDDLGKNQRDKLRKKQVHTLPELSLKS